MAFGSYHIVVDKKLSEILNVQEGSRIKPQELTKKIWVYIKKNNLGKN